MKRIIPLLASLRTKVNRMLINVYDDDDNSHDIYISIG